MSCMKEILRDRFSFLGYFISGLGCEDMAESVTDKEDEKRRRKTKAKTKLQKGEQKRGKGKGYS